MSSRDRESDGKPRPALLRERRGGSASGGSVVNAAMQPAVLAIVAGLVAGLAVSVGLNTVVARWSIGTLSDPVVLVAVGVVLCVVTMMSAAIPANRAASIQPADALRID